MIPFLPRTDLSLTDRLVLITIVVLLVGAVIGGILEHRDRTRR